MEPLIFQADQVIYCDDDTKWFDHYMPVIPTNSIIHKTITGFGATTTEIKSSRNSIIILPNVSTIHNKYDRHKNDNEGYTVFAVYEGVSGKRIAEYLKSNNSFKKILTTPESLDKVRRAFDITGIKGTSDFFLLMDETHKYIQDNDYRPQITKALDYFFEFVNKAMISSTPIKPSDPRFAGFDCVKLQPAFKHSKPIELLYHNNVLFALKNIFKRNSEIKQCIFFNSINGIMDIIKKLGIGQSSTIFCSKESAKYLITLTYSEGCFFKAQDRFDAEAMNQYNFFTSSLFNGLDIILNEPPQVSIISVPNDPKTYLDPFTDVIQILGRFRKHECNLNGYYGKAVHLLEAVYRDNYKSTEEVKQWFDANQNIYETVLTLMYSNTNQAERELYREALKRLPFHEYLANNYHLHRNNPSNPTYPNDQNPDKFTFDYFKIDNLYEEERVNSYYKNPSYLWRAYQKVGLVKVNNVELASFEFSSNYCYATIAGQPKLNLRGGKRYSKENIKQLVAQLCELYDLSGEYEIYDNAVLEITKHHPLIRSAFDKLGERRIAELEFSITKIKQALIDYDVKTGKNHNAIIDSVYTMFILNVKIPLKKIKKDLQKIYDHYKIPAIAKASGLALWFEIKECKIVTSTTNKITLTKVREEQRAYILLRYKFNLHRQLHIT